MNDTEDRKIIAAENRRKAVEFRKMGLAYSEIAAKLGMSKAGVHKAVTKAMIEVQKEIDKDAEIIRAVELSRLDKLQFAVWPHAMKGSVQSVDRVLKVMERRARLLGLDAPERHVIDTDLSDEDRAILERFKNGG